MKPDQPNNAIVDDYAIRFVSSDKSKENQLLKAFSNSSSDEDNKESGEPDYMEEESNDKQSEEKQQEETGELALITSNQVF